MSVVVVLDSVTPLLERLKTAAAAQGVALVAARAVGSQVKEHLYKLDGLRHKPNGHHFYRQAGDSVTTGLAPAGAFVSVTQLGFRQRLKGGEILPKTKQYLTIPASPEAYEHRAGEFNDLDVAMAYDPERDCMRLALVRRASVAVSFVRRKRVDGTVKTTVKPGALRGGEVMFWLVKRVFQRPDPSVLPRQQDMMDTAKNAATARLARLEARAAGGAS